MKTRFLAILLLGTVIHLAASARSADERIAEAMNRADWFGLDSVYRTAPKDSINPFLEVFTRCLTGNRLNRPDVSLPAFRELFSHHAAGLGLDNTISAAVMFATDLSREGLNAAAHTVMTHILDANGGQIDPAAMTALREMASGYEALSKFYPYDVSIPGQTGGVVPFSLSKVGPEDSEALMMIITDSSVNGHPSRVTFDTGAGVNIISDSLATAFGLTFLENTRTVTGVAAAQSRQAIAGELRLGNITVKDVPFYVMNITSNNPEADKYMHCLDIVVGSELMFQLKDLTIDFLNSVITVPATAPSRSEAAPNMCLSSSMNLLSRGSVMGDRMLMNIDSGDSSFGSLDHNFFKRHRDFVTTHSKPDTIRHAGIGGTYSAICHRMQDVPVEAGGNQVTIPELVVRTEAIPAGDSAEYECNLGLQSLMMFGKVRFNLVDMVMTTYPPRLSLSMTTPRLTHRFNFRKEFNAEQYSDDDEDEPWLGQIIRAIIFHDTE